MAFPSIQLPRFTTETMSYTNLTGGSYNSNGKFVPGTSNTITFNGTLLPLTDTDLKYDIGGTYTSQDYKLYCTVDFNESQIFTYDGNRYEIQQADDRFTFANYRRYIVRRVGDVVE